GNRGAKEVRCAFAKQDEWRGCGHRRPAEVDLHPCRQDGLMLGIDVGCGEGDVVVAVAVEVSATSHWPVCIIHVSTRKLDIGLGFQIHAAEEQQYTPRLRSHGHVVASGLDQEIPEPRPLATTCPWERSRGVY